MLLEIYSDVFRENRLAFHAGLNVIIGDRDAKNSIGKSTTLMVVDFVFGGNSFLELNKDVVTALGHHSYKFCFEFEGSRHYFRRDSLNPGAVLRCDSDYKPREVLELNDYTDWLKAQYISDKYALTFRAFVGIFSRIWPKENVTNVRKPLHAVPGQSPKECIANLIKIFERFREIESAHQELASKESERAALNRAAKYSIIEKIGKKKYSENEVQLAKINADVQDIKAELAKYALNIRAVADKQLLELKQSKDALLQERLKIEEKLLRTQRNLDGNKYIQSKQFDSLVEFFPNVNTERIAEIEVFHSSLAAVLKSELIESRKNLHKQREEIDSELKKIDARISERLANYENPTALVDRVYELSNRWNKLHRENALHEKQTKIEEEYKSMKGALTELKTAILHIIEQRINMQIGEIVDRVYGIDAKTPILTLGENSYKYDIVDDTGTGKAFANLVIFDLAIFALTDLPILIHDTPLFKNVENEAVSKFIEEYISFNKQSFVALDEVQKYGRKTEKALLKHKVIQLSNDAVLYTKDWRKR